jgi:hypothetical protein
MSVWRRVGAGHLLAVCVMVGACSGNTPPGTSEPQLAVGGTYATAVTLEQNTCGAMAVEPRPTTVTHTAGASTLTLAHAGQTYQGTVQRSGAFSTTPRAIAVTGGTHTLTVAGHFLATGFDALVTADVAQSAAPQTCRYVVHWIGTKQGGANVIP